MGDAVDRLRDLVQLTIRVPPHIRHVDGKFIHVDAYTRKGQPAEKAPPKPKARVVRTIPATMYPPKDLQTNENVKVAVDTLRKVMVTDWQESGASVEDWLSDPDTRDALKSHAFLFDAVRKPTHKAQLTKAGKIMAGREWGRYDTMLRTSRLLARLQSGNIEKPEATKEFWDLMDNRLVPKVMGADYPIPISQVRNALIDRAKAFGIGTDAHVPEKPTGEEPLEAEAPEGEVLGVVKEGVPTPTHVTLPGGGHMPIQAGQSWYTGTGPGGVGLYVKDSDGSLAFFKSGSNQVNASWASTSPVAKMFHQYAEAGQAQFVAGAPLEAKVELPGLPGVKVTPPEGPIDLIPGVITPGVEQIGEWEIKAGDEVYISEEAKTPMQAANLLIRHPDGTAHIIGAAVAGGVMQAPSGIMAALNTPDSGWHLYGKVPGGPPVLGGKIDVLTIDVPQQSGEGTKKVVVSPSDEVWKGYGGAVGVHHMDDTWTVYDLGPDKHIKPGDTSWEAWDKVGQGVNPNWEQIEPEAVKAMPPTKEPEPEPEPAPKPAPKPKAKKKPKVVVPTVPLYTEDIEALKEISVTTYGSGDGVDQFMTRQRSRYLQALTAVQQEKQWPDASEYWMYALGKQSMIDLLTEIVGQTETARTDPQFNLQPGQKAKLAKDRKRYEALLEAATLSRDLDTLPEDELDARMASVGEKFAVGTGYYDKGPYTKLFTKGSKAWKVPNWPYNQKTIFPALQTRVEKRLFDVRSEELGFDYMSADDATLASFIGDKGAGDIAPWLDTEQKRDWIRVWLRDPSILDKYSPDYNATDKYADVLQKLTKAATISMSVDKVTKMANLDFHAHAEPEGPDPAQQNAIADQLVEAQKRFELLKGLKQRYRLPKSPGQLGTAEYAGLILQKEDGSWEIKFGIYEGQAAEESEVIDLLLTQTGWEEDSDAKALTQHMLDEAEAKQLLGMPTGAATRKVQNTWIKDHGGSNVGKMTQPEREEWITAHLMQNNLMKFQIEYAAGLKAKNPVPHPGEKTHPGSPESPNGKAAWQLFSDQAAVSVWGDIYRSGVPVPDWGPGEVITFATAMHLDYGFPPETGGIPEAIARDRVADFLDILPGTFLPPVSPGLETIVPGELLKGPPAKPEGVSDDGFSLLEALKVVTPDQHAVALFSKTADGFSNEQVDVYLKNSSIFGGSNALAMAGIYTAPLPLKQATVAAMKGLNEEAPFPDDFMEAVKGQVQAGVFDPDKPEGYYGAVSNGETVYYLKPGDKVMEAGEYQTVSIPGAVAGPAGLPTQVTAEGGVTIVLQPGEVAYQFAKPDGGGVYGSISIRYPDGSWAIGAGTSKVNKMTPEAALKNGWEAPNEPSGVYQDLTPVGAGPSTQTTFAPPKDEVYGFALKPGDEVYTAPGYPLGHSETAPALVLHAGGGYTQVSPNGDTNHFTMSKEEFHNAFQYDLVAAGPTAVTPTAGAFALKTDDVVYQFGSNSSWIKHSDGSWTQVAIVDTVPIAGAGMVTAGTVTAHVLPGTDAAANLENPTNTIYHKPPLDSPHVSWPEAFTYAYTPTKKVGQGPFVLKPDDLVYPAGESVYVKHADGSWERLHAATGLPHDSSQLPEGKASAGSAAADNLEQWVQNQKVPATKAPAETWPDAFTLMPKKVGHGPFALAPDDTVYQAGTGVLYVKHADGSWERIFSGEGSAAGGTPAVTHNMPKAFADSHSGLASTLNAWAEKRKPVSEPAVLYPNAFTLEVPGAPTAPTPGAVVVQPKSVLWVQHADGTGSWITAGGVENVTDEQVSGLFAASHAYIPLKPTSLPPKPIESYKQAQAMGLPPGVPPSLWEVAVSADELDEDWWPPDLVASDEEIRTGLLTAKETFGVEVSIAFVENAPPQVQRALYDHLASGSPTEVLAPLVGVMNWKADHQHWGSKTYKPPFPAGKPYTPYILAGLTDNSSVASWPYDALSQFQSDYKVNGAEAIAAKLEEVLVGKKPIVPSMSAGNEPLKFSDDPDAGHQGGSHSGNRGIKDQHGNKYLYKIYQNDPKSPAMRVEQEIYSARISNLLGFHHPPVQDPVTVLGHYAYIQLKVPFKFDMQGVHPEDLDDNILTQVGEEHVLDWILANADTYYSNIAVSGDGKHVIGIDKGQAFKNFPNDELSPTYTGGNPIPPYYNEMYAAVISHKITKERADAMVRHLLIRAKRVAQAHDPEYRALLEKAFASRTDFKGMSKDEFIDALIERKHAAAESFEEMWKGVYAKAGYSWDHPPLDELQFSKIETERGSAWSGISPEYFEAVEETKVHGRSAMFAGTDLEDGHLLFFEEKDTEGKRVLLGEGKLREAADGRLTAWLQAQKVGDATGSVVTPQAYVLPKNDAWYQKIVAGAMTVNHHSDDGEYNATHLDALVTAKEEIGGYKAAIGGWAQEHPNEPFHGGDPWNVSFPDTDAQKAFLDMIDTYLQIIEEIETAKANQTKTPNKKYTQYVYTPKAKAKVDEEWKSQTHTLQKTETGEWHQIDESGTDTVITDAEAQTLIDSGNFNQGTQGKAVTNLQVKVYKRPASRPQGVLDLDTGELKESGGEEKTGSSGQEYDVEIGDRIVLEYRPWNGANQPLADQGFFRIRVKNWDGDEADLEQAFQQLAAMGVDLTPADEESLELLYWRLWEGVAGTRAQTPVAVQTVVKNIKAWRTQNPNASDAEELEFLRSAWTPYLGEDKVENVDFMPKFDHTRPQNPDEETGRPYWYRPDATLDDMLDTGGVWHFGSQDVTYGGSESDKKPIAQSGGLDSSDERLRLYGHWLQKGSSLQDKPKGSTGQVFTRPKFSSSNHIAFVPDVFLRMQTYAASSDKWGAVATKASYAPFSVDGLKQASTEMMVKNTVTVLDSFIVLRFNNQADRDAVVQWYKGHGIHTIRGVPVEERFIVASNLNQSMVNKLWERELVWRAEQKQEAAAMAA